VLEENAPVALFDEETHTDITAGRTMRSGRVHATPLATLTETNECIRESSEDFHDVGPPLDDDSILTPPAEPPADLVVHVVEPLLNNELGFLRSISPQQQLRV
jgi:hypothetical protein